MSNFNPPFPGPALHEARPNNQQRHSGDFRPPPPPPPPPPGSADGNAPVPVPTGAAQRGMNGNSARGMAGFDGPRSPPNNKSTAHVPCKFFRQGTCQAGKACPFMHSNEPTTEVAPCKYFQKGNCKFGAKCALAHILPDGRRVNKPSHLGMGGGYNLGGRMNIPPNEVPPGSASLLSMQMPGPQQQFGFSSLSDEYFQAQQQQQRSAFDNIPTIDTTFSSHPGSNYGSPPNEKRLGISPVQKGLSVMDAPLPASFDSQGISHIARYGPMAKSVPSRFGFDISPPSSLPKPAADSRTLQNLHNSAFGDDNRATRNGFGSSPPQHDDFPGRRIMHSDRLTRPNMLSSSLDTRKIGRATMSQDEWDENFAFEEDLVPTALHDLLTEKEKMRRFSRTEDDTFRHSLSGLGTPTNDASKLGSSPKVGSPSRFSALFARQAHHHKSDHPAHHSSDTPPPGFGHVGSPLRNSSLHPGASPAPRAVRTTSSSSATTTTTTTTTTTPAAGDLSPFLASPPRQASMSIISQQLQRTRLSSRAGSSSHIPDTTLDTSTTSNPPASLHPSLARAPSASSTSSSSAAAAALGGAGGGAPSSAVRASLDRAVSAGSVARSERIDEEQGLFRMEDEEEILERRKLGDGTPSGGAGKRFSGGWGAFAGLGASPGAGGMGRKEGVQVGTGTGLGTSPGTIGGHRISSGKEGGGGSGAGVKEGAGGVWGNGSGSGR